MNVRVGKIRLMQKGKLETKTKTEYPLPAAIFEEQIYQKGNKKNPIKYLNEKGS